MKICLIFLCKCSPTTEIKHKAQISLEQRILSFERECEERTRKIMEEKVFDKVKREHTLFLTLRWRGLKQMSCYM